MSETPEVRKVSALQNVSAELFAAYAAPSPFLSGYVETPEERAQRIARTNARWALYDAAVPRLAGITDPLARTLLDLHAADERNNCEGCDFGGYDADYPEWPCRTTRAIAEAYDIELPDYVPHARPQIGPEPKPRSVSDILSEYVLDVDRAFTFTIGDADK